MDTEQSTSGLEDQAPVAEAQQSPIKKEKKKIVMTEKALENLKKAREILKEKRAEAKTRGEKLVSKKKMKKMNALQKTVVV